MSFSLATQVDLKGGLPARVEELPEGQHAGLVTKTQVKTIETKNGPATLFELVLKVSDQLYSLTYWLTSEANLKRCLTSLKRIGFDCDSWGPNFGRPYTDELEDAGKKMTGCLLSFKRGSSNQGYATIGLEGLDESEKPAPVSDADLPF
jgi:hypothetical protein